MNNLLKILEKSKLHANFNKDDKILIIDGMNTWIRVVSSIAAVNENGVNIGGIIGFLRSIGSNIREFNPSRCIIVFDGKGGSLRRRKIYSEYKANRTGKFKPRQVEGCELNDEQLKESMKWQLQRTIMYLEHLPIQMLCLDNIEADDTIAYICKQYFEKHDNKIRILSTDRDFLQLVSPQIEVYSPVKKVLYNLEKIQSELTLLPSNYLLYRTLTGDVSDNIEGVKGLGLKTLIKSFPEMCEIDLTLDDIFNKCEKELLNKKPKEIYKTILNTKNQILINYKIMQLHDTDISGNSKNNIIDIVNAEIKKTNKQEFKQLLMEDGLNNTFKNPDTWLYDTFNGLNVWAKT
jgi:5'-3' exonuclease